MTHRLRRACLATALLAAAGGSAAAAPGRLDPSFGQNGLAVIRVPGTIGLAQTLVQSDGSILVVSSREPPRDHSHFGIVIDRVLSNGTPDASFGKNGEAEVGKPHFSLIADNALLQADGKLLVCGTAADFPAKSHYDNPSVLYVARFMPDGTPDAGFGKDGAVFLPVLAQNNSAATALLEQDNGAIVAVGQATNGGGKAADVMLRFSSAGVLDTGFGQNGVFSISPPHSDIGSDLPVAAALQSDGKIIVGALQTEARKPALTFRVNADGTLDKSDAAGQVTSSPQASAAGFTGFAFQPNSDYVLSNSLIVRHQGTGYERFVLKRFTLASRRDPAFAKSRIDYAGRPPQNASDAANAVLVQPNGALVAAGSRSVFEKSGAVKTVLGIVRENADGTLDTTFGQNGLVTTKIGGLFPRFSNLALQSDGNIVAAGSAYDKVFLARYLDR